MLKIALSVYESTIQDEVLRMPPSTGVEKP